MQQFEQGKTVYTIKLVAYKNGSYGIKTRDEGSREERVIRDVFAKTYRWQYLEAIDNLRKFLTTSMAYRFDRPVDE